MTQINIEVAKRALEADIHLFVAEKISRFTRETGINISSVTVQTTSVHEMTMEGVKRYDVVTSCDIDFYPHS